MIAYAGFGRRLAALLASALVDLVVLGVLSAVGVGEWRVELWLAWLAVHHVGLVAEGGTFGQRLLALRVVQVDGSRTGVIRACIRALASVVSALPLGLGALWMLDEPRRRTWHDLAAGTVIVHELPRGARAVPEWADAPPWRREPPVASTPRVEASPSPADPTS